MAQSQSSTDNLALALRYGTLGYRCIPIVRGMKRAAIAWKLYQTETPTPKAYEQWFGVEDHDIALLTGEMIVVDCDDPAFFDVVTERCGTTPMVCQTPRGGRHFYYRPRSSGQLGNRVKIDDMPIDLRAEGGYVVVPWSTNAEGVGYRWLEGPVSVNELPVINDEWIPTEPEWQPKPLVISHSRIERAQAYLTRIEGAVSGQGGHDQTFRAACVLVQRFGLTVDEAFPLLWEWNRTCVPPWSEKELLHKLQDASRLSHWKGEWSA
jgi:hypothetical protein